MLLSKSSIIQNNKISLEFSQVKAFVAVADSLSFTKAAQRLNLSQPAVSVKVKALEKHLGVLLFRRLHSHIQLTDAGHHALAICKRILGDVESLQDHFLLATDAGAARVTLFLPVSIGVRMMAPLLERLESSKPEDVFIDLKACGSEEEVVEQVVASRSSIGILRNQPVNARLTSVPWCTHPLSLLVHPSHPLAAQAAVSIEEILSEPVLFPEQDSTDHALLSSRLLTVGLQPSDFLERRHVPIDLMATLVANGQWIALRFSLPWLEADRDGLRNLSLHEFPVPYVLHLVSPLPPAGRQLQTPGLSTAANRVLGALLALGAAAEESRHAQLIESMRRALGTEPGEELIERVEIPSLRSSPASAQRPLPGSDSAEKSPLPFRIGVQHRTIQTVLGGRAVQQLGLLDNFLDEECFSEGTVLSPRWIDHASAAPMITSLLEGKLDLAIMGDYAITHLATAAQESSADRFKLVAFVSVNPHGSGASLILPRNSNLTDLRSLVSHSVAVPTLSTAYGSLLYNLRAQELIDQIYVQSINLIEVFQHSMGKVEADSYACFTPHDHYLVAKDQFRWADEQISVPFAFYGVVVRDSFARRYPGAIRAFLKAMACSQYWFYSTPSAIECLSRWTGIDGKIVHSVLGERQGQKARDCHYQPDLSIRNDWLEEYATRIYTPSQVNAGRSVVLPEVEDEFLKSALADLNPFRQVQATTSK